MSTSPDKGNSKKEVANENAPGLIDSYESIQQLERVMFTVKVDYVKNGITKLELAAFREIIDLDWVTLSQLLTVTDRTLHLKKEHERLGLNVSDRVMAIAEVYGLGYNTFQDRDLFHDWMQRSNLAFGGLLPIQMMETSVGIAEVKDELGRIRYGVI